MKKVRERTNQITLSVILMMLLGLCLLVFAPQVHAQSTGSITIKDAKANGLTLNLYQIATFDGHQFTAKDESYKSIVAKMPIDSTAHADEWTAAAQNLHEVIQKNGVAADQSKTVSGGNLSFLGLAPGLYLMDGKPVTNNNQVVTPAPALISVPTKTSVDGTYDVVVTEVKKTITPNHPNEPNNPTPNTPSNPKTPNKPTTTKVKTGDPTEIGIYVALLAVTAAALSYAAVMWQRRRRKDS